MRVLHVTRDFPPRRNGGISTAVGGLVEASRAAGVDCAVLSFDAWRPKGKPAPTLPDTDDVVRVGGPADLERARAMAARFAPDVVHVHHAMLWAMAAELPVAARRIFSVHVVQRVLRELRGLDAPTASERAQARALAEADAVLVPSAATRREIAAIAGRDAHLARLGVSPPPAMEGARGSHVLDRALCSVLYVGRLADVKGTAELFGAIDRVVARVPDARFVLAGGLPDSPRVERRWRARFEAETSAAGRRATTFLGWLDPDALEAAHAEARLLVAPSWHETFGLAVAEAMARGLPVVASDAGALPERVTDGVDGVLVPPRDPAALADAIAAVLEDPDRLARMGRAARDAAPRWSAVIGEHLAAYRTE